MNADDGCGFGISQTNSKISRKGATTPRKRKEELLHFFFASLRLRYTRLSLADLVD
jgi:hypothetical protein